LNKSVTSKTTSTSPNIGRISGSTTGTRSNNYAWSGMELTANSKPVSPSYATNSRDGTGINAAYAQTDTTWTTAANWDTTAPASAWDFTAAPVWEWDPNGDYMPSLVGVGEPQPWPVLLKDGNAEITLLTIAQITNRDPSGLPNNITLSRSNAGGNSAQQIITIDPDDYDAGSIEWKIFGAGAATQPDIMDDTGTGTFTLDANDISYNSLGAHTLRLTVKIGAVPYMVNIKFTIVE